MKHQRWRNATTRVCSVHSKQFEVLYVERTETINLNGGRATSSLFDQKQQTVN